MKGRHSLFAACCVLLAVSGLSRFSAADEPKKPSDDDYSKQKTQMTTERQIYDDVTSLIQQIKAE